MKVQKQLYGDDQLSIIGLVWVRYSAHLL